MTSSLDTLCVQGGYSPKNGASRQVPIIYSTTFRWESSKEMAALFDLEKEGYFYSRLQNPTCDTVASKIAALEGGCAAMLTGSGQAASFFSIFNICSAGDHILSSSEIYGGTFNQLAHTLKRMGISVSFFSPDSSDAEIQKLFRPETKAIFGETVANPSLAVFDIERFARLAHKNGVPLIIDNTFPTPILCQPFEWGADIVVHSTTKYMDGHGSAIGGAIVDSGNFDWTKSDKFPGLTTPDETYHGVTYTERFGKGAYIIKAVAQLMRDLGSVQSPMSAYLLNLGLESLHLRMRKHSENAAKVADFLSRHDKIVYTRHASLAADPTHDLSAKYLRNGACGVIGFGVIGGRQAAEKLMSSLKKIIIATHVADARSCVLHPASATHRQMSDDELKAAGIKPDFIRLSVGIEDAADLINDLKQALAEL